MQAIEQNTSLLGVTATFLGCRVAATCHQYPWYGSIMLLAHAPVVQDHCREEKLDDLPQLGQLTFP